MAGRKQKKITYPEKRTMNLYYKPDRTTVPATISLYVLFAVTLMIGFGKFFVYDLLEKNWTLERQLSRLEQEQQSLEQELSDYEEVRHRYQLYSATEDEDNQTDRMEVLDLLDTALRPQAAIGQVTISKGTVNVQLDGVTLSETAELVRALEQSPIVLRTTVDTASTEENGEGRVTANIQITLQRESEVEEK